MAKALDQAFPLMPIRAGPYAHQRAAYEFALELYGISGQVVSRGCAFLMDMGTGKTLTSIAVVGALYQADRIRRVLIVAPLSILGVWRDEFAKFAAFDYRLVALTGSTAKKADMPRDAHRIVGNANNAHPPLIITVVNYESAWRLEREIILWKPDMIICDEGHKIKTPNTAASKAMHRIGARAAYRLLLTGTVITNKALDVFSQWKFLNPLIFGTKYSHFKARYFDAAGYGGYTMILKKHMETELMDKVHSIAFRARKADCLDLPETTDITRYVDLKPSANRIYHDLVRESVAELDRGEITVTNVLTRLLRLSQLTGGFLSDDDGGAPQQVSTAKMDALSDILDTMLEEGRKLVIIARFIPEINAIRKLLEKRGAAYSLIMGGVTDRDEQVSWFQNDVSVPVFIGQIATAGLGVTLTASSTMVFYSLDYSMSNFEQAKARIHRVGQEEKCTYIYLTVRGTVDDKVLQALRDKADLAHSLIDDYRSGGNPFLTT
ncbi:MAG: DEAD/DEAH box helicase [Oscillospiraceae bacterium]|jgi:SNF2 family DNA or RNA helicase|nr:DEAD/DEAH box helicase [Oscillospiraceae bacterium]